MNANELNKTSAVLSNGLTAMEFTALSDAAFEQHTPYQAIMLVRSRTGLGLHDSKCLLRKAVTSVALWF